ncbi:MAG: hypothetical protein J6W52_04645 [Bacteroidaceae bacterium]|nr:hypothetical protein [Bacteroidaceae bacterium]
MCRAIKLFILCFAVLCSCTSDDPEVEICKIDETTFPDANFRNWVLGRDYGKDGILTNAEMTEIKKLQIPLLSIQSLKGIEYFTALTYLNCANNNLSTLDLSCNVNLTGLSCSHNNLTSINLSKNTKLEGLWCFNNKLTSLDLTNNPALTNLECTRNNLTSINLSKNTALIYLNCCSCPITSIDLSYNIMLEIINIHKCKLTTLNVSKNTKLKSLSCYENQISGAGMDALVKSLPAVTSGELDIFCRSDVEQNVMTAEQVEAAKAKGWIAKWSGGAEWTPYPGSTRSESVSFAKGQMATIILPTTPDADKGRYYRLDRCENGRAIFAEELQPKARTPYIIVPKEDFGIDVSTMELDGLSRDSVSIGRISFIGTYYREEMNCQEGFYIDIIDSTPDCLIDNETQRQAIVGALRACLIVCWDDPYTQSPTKSITEKMEIILEDNTNM